MSQRDIIGIGGSMGAVDAVKSLCAALPADLPAAVFIVIHAHGDGQTLLAHALDAASPLPVRIAHDGDPVGQSRVYVAPAGHHMLVLDGEIRLGRGPRENMSRPAIDPLFRSLGVSYGPRAVAAVLTGTLNDGAAGLADLKRCGGTTMVQNPADAAAPEMPLSALRASDIDYRAPLEEMAALLTQIVGEDAGPHPGVPDAVRLEVEIALGRAPERAGATALGTPVPLSCPACGGVLSEMKGASPLRFRCQVGHAYTAEILSEQQEGAVDEAVRVALRIVQERLVLTERMADDARRNGHTASASMLASRAKEYSDHADVLRKAALREGS